MSLTQLGPDAIAKQLYRSDNVHRPLPNLDAFDDSAIERYRRDGFIAIENVFTHEEVDSALAGITQLVKDGNPEIVTFEDVPGLKEMSPEQRESCVRKCMSFVEHEPRLNAMAHNEKLLSVVRRLIGSDVVLSQDMALLKPPMVGREKPWHQDSAYFNYGPANLLMGTWTALDEATIANGCMHVIPGSHHEGGKAHYHDRDCQLPDEVVDVAKDVVVPLKPGGVLFFSGLLHHGTPPNKSPQRRRAVQYHYRSVNAKALNLEQIEEMFHDSKGVAACAVGRFGKKVRPMSERDL